MKQIRKRLTYANVMSSIAVFLVLGGATALAAGGLGKNTVGTKQLKKNAVVSSKVKNGSLTAADFATGQLPAGPQGPKGDKGERGEKGDKGEKGAVSSPSSLFRRTTFLFESALQTSFATIATLEAVPQSTGNALVRARGYCNIAPDALETNEIDLAVGSSLADASSSKFSEWGVIRITKNSETVAQAYGWTAEREIPVTAGVPMTAVLAARGSGAGTQKDCSGTLTVEAIF